MGKWAKNGGDVAVDLNGDVGIFQEAIEVLDGMDNEGEECTL